jgi:transcriptional regulator with GAF, ATPase, and Fis domain
MSTEHRALRWWQRVRDLTRRLAAERDPEKLPKEILDVAIELTEAERGFLVLVLGERPQGGFEMRLIAARGFGGEAFPGNGDSVSQSVLRRVLEEDRGLVTSAEEDRDLLQVSSVVERRVRSIACVPLRLRGQVRGALYLDHRFVEGAFQAAELPVLETFADQAALALETSELQDRYAKAAGKLHEAQEALQSLRAGEAPPADFQAPRGFGELVGTSPAMIRLYDELERAARSWDPVLIQGESGAGLEQVARQIHARSGRDGPFLTRGCAATSDALLESELFGHVRGAYTGASRARQGLFQRAAGGSLFLEGIEDLSPPLQARLDETLKNGAVQAIGSDAPTPLACRVLCSAGPGLRERVAQGQFRADLFFRLDVLRLEVPPLRERADDLPHLVAQLVEGLGSPALDVLPGAVGQLQAYGWPGNEKELHNEVRRWVARGLTRVRRDDLSEEIRAGRGLQRGPGDLAGKTLPELEAELVRIALRETQGNKAAAARQLGIPRQSLYHLIKRHGLA